MTTRYKYLQFSGYTVYVYILNPVDDTVLLLLFMLIIKHIENLIKNYQYESIR